MSLTPISLEVGSLDLPRPLAFVLGGGGSLGASQVGMLQALAEYQLRPDLIVGTSVGSLNGAFLASDPLGAATRLSHLWPEFERDTFLPGSAWQSVRTLRSSRTNLYSNDGLARFLDDHLSVVPNIEDLVVPFVAMATDVDTRQPVALTDGPLKSALLASAAIPGVFPAVERDGRALYDGGIVANLPVRQALSMGAKSLVLLDCNDRGKQRSQPKSVREVIEWTLTLMLGRQANADLPYIGHNVPVVYLPGPRRAASSPLDFDRTVELMRGAYEASREFLGSLEIDGPGVYQAVGDEQVPEDPLTDPEPEPGEGRGAGA
ncbi:MAG: patatin-like phospholipase family protein [Microthrixaceae bacterium]